MSELELSVPLAAPERASATPSFMPEAIGHRLPGLALAERVATSVARAGFPEVNETLLTAETAKAIEQIRAGTPLPVDSDASKGDAYFLADVAEAKDRTLRLEHQLTDAEEKKLDTRRELARLQPPLSIRKWAGLIGALIVITVLGVLTLTALLSSSFDELLYRDYYRGLTVAEAELVSARHAEWLVIWAASFLLGGKALAIVGSSGRLSRLLKLLLIGVALLFSAAVACLRLAEGMSLAAVVVSLVELALLASYSLVLIALSMVFKESADRAVAYRALNGAAAVEEEQVERLGRAAEAARRDYETRRLALAQREDDCRRLPLNEAAARATVEAEYLVATLELITKAAQSVYGSPSAMPAAVEEQNGGAL